LQLDGFGHSAEGFAGDLDLLSLGVSLNTNEFNEDYTWRNNDTTTTTNNSSSTATTSTTAAAPAAAPAVATLAAAAAAAAVPAYASSGSSSRHAAAAAIGGSSCGVSSGGYTGSTMVDRESSTRAALQVHGLHIYNDIWLYIVICVCMQLQYVHG
jgi:hypothetical protein